MALLLLRSTLATLVAFGGGALGVALSRAAARRLPLLVIAAMAVLAFVTLTDVLPDAKALLPWPAFLLATVSGYGLFWALGRFVAPLCPACSLPSSDPSARLARSIPLLLIVLGLHSAMDGVAVVVGDQITGRPNLLLLLAVSLHKLPEGLALALLLLGAGYARGKALGWTWAIESTTELGALGAVLGLRHVPPFGLGLLMAHVGGGFVYLITTTLGAFVSRGETPGHEAAQLHD